MSTVHSISGRQRYGIVRVCRVWEVSRATLYRIRARHGTPPGPRRRPGPTGPMPDQDLVQRIRVVLANSPFHGEGYRKVWARLRYAGVRTSQERVRRLMREHDLAAARAGGTPRGPRAHDGTIIPEGVDQSWGTDMTAAVTTREGQAAFGIGLEPMATDASLIAVDHFTAECVGIHAAKRGTRLEALEPVRQGVRARFGAIGKDVAVGLSLRHDHGTQYMSHDFQNEIRWFGMTSSPAFVRAPEGNGCAERFIRTPKENLLWVRTFETVEDLRQALIAFQRRYNEEWLIQRHGYRSPAQFRRDLEAALPAAA